MKSNKTQQEFYCRDLRSNQYPFHLSHREQEVLKLLVEGHSNSEMATLLHLSVSTIKTYIRSLMNKFAVEHRIQIAVFAVRHQMVE
ncbi:MAG: DNA-binding response regulator [Pegethrix bostrychoides GSE-TBD4-15B]|uniref:DNA-binding response regulator n=1 Tax=Pegethrix bostrychoides GSE-TBD4-15B TaxID=2839662 RepID=A0A951P996_9CYAN|nr:DNA-binding response regulator [Pegethrix bostrychoides GSE-TBD4-15B]